MAAGSLQEHQGVRDFLRPPIQRSRLVRCGSPVIGDYENQSSARADGRTRWLGQLLSRNHQNMLKNKVTVLPTMCFFVAFCCMLLLYFPGFGIVFIGMLPVIAIWKIIMPYHFVEEIGLRSAHRDSAMKCSPWPKDHCSRHIRIILSLKQRRCQN